MSLGKKNTLLYVLAVTIVLGLSMLVLYVHSKNSLLDMAKDRAEDVIRTFEVTTNDNNSDFKNNIQSQLNALEKSMPELYEFTIYDINAHTAIASSVEENINEKADQEDIDASKADSPIVIFANQKGNTIIDVTAPLHLGGKKDYVCGIAIKLNDEMNDIHMILIKMGVVGALTLGIIVFLIWFFSVRRTSGNLRKITWVSNEVAKGNLHVKADVSSKDEIGQLAQNINNMSLALAHIIVNVMKGSKQVSENAQKLAQASGETAASIEEVAKIVDGLASRTSSQTAGAKNGTEKLLMLAREINNVFENSKQIKQYANETSALNEEGRNVLIQLEEKLKINNDVSGQIGENANTLLEKSSSISQVVDTIQSIAEQTNLLALNAAIEAARAGEQGKGFAVVADEIRTLAEQTSLSTKTIALIVREIQSLINTTKNNIDLGASSLNKVNEKLVDTTNAFEDISKAVKNSIEQLDILTVNLQKISTDKDEVVSLMGEIARISESNASSTEEVSATIQIQTVSIEDISTAAEKLKDIAIELDNVVGEFKI